MDEMYLKNWLRYTEKKENIGDIKILKKEVDIISDPEFVLLTNEIYKSTLREILQQIKNMTPNELINLLKVLKGE